MRLGWSRCVGVRGRFVDEEGKEGDSADAELPKSGDVVVARRDERGDVGRGCGRVELGVVVRERDEV